MTADTKEFLRAGNEDSAKRLIQTLNPLSNSQQRKGIEESKSKIKNGISKK